MQVIMMKPLFIGLIGSRMWGHARPDSDYDYFVVYQLPNGAFLWPDEPVLSFQIQRGKIDIQAVELKQYFKQLLKGNFQYLLYVLGSRDMTAHADITTMAQIAKDEFMLGKGLTTPWRIWMRDDPDRFATEDEAKEEWLKVSQEYKAPYDVSGAD